MMSDEQTFDENHKRNQRYEIRIEGHLDGRWTEWFEGLGITLEENGDTLLTGPVVDQAALHGLLKKVRDLGMPLISVSSVEPGDPAALSKDHADKLFKKEKRNEQKQRNRKKSAGCEDNPCSSMGSWNVKQFKRGYIPLICGYRTYRSKPGIIVGISSGAYRAHFYECLYFDVEVSSEPLG
jgi:hypothetical protein